MKKLMLAVGVCATLFTGCNKSRKEFTLKSVKLNSYPQSKYPAQSLSLKVIEDDESNSVLATTGNYPSIYTLPATFAVNPTIKMKLYKEKNHYAVQLWGDSSGLIGTSHIDMDEYKIIFPIDMETKSDDVGFILTGSWK